MTVEFDVIDLFPTPVAGVVLDYDFSALNQFKDCAISAYKQKITEVEKLKKINKVDFYVLDRVPEIKKYLTSVTRDLLNSQYRYKDKFVINTSWLTKMPYESIGIRHKHAGNPFSAVLYFGKYDEQSAPLCFHSPVSIVNNYDLKAPESNHRAWQFFNFSPKENLLLIFPSYLEHEIGMNLSKSDRYSLAFNIYPVSVHNQGDSEVDIQKLVKQIDEY